MIKINKLITGVLTLLFAMPLVFATITINSPTYAEGANRTQIYVEVNVSSTDYINSSLANLEWNNQTGTRLNLSPNQVVNFTLNAACASNNCNYSFWNISGLLDGQHTFKAYIRENESAALRVSAARNLTQDDTIPTIIFDEPTNGTSYSSSGSTLTLKVNITDNVIGFRNAACTYELNGVNTSITNCNNLSSIVTVQGGTNTLEIIANDSNNNRATPEITFIFTQTSGSGGGGGGISSNLPKSISPLIKVPNRPGELPNKEQLIEKPAPGQQVRTETRGFEISNIAKSIGDSFANFGRSISDWFAGLFKGFGKPVTIPSANVAPTASVYTPNLPKII